MPAGKLAEKQPVFPLVVHLCGECRHAQLLDVVDPEFLFRHYVYVSGTSPVFVEHFRRYAEALAAYLPKDRKSFVVDIGSNDGTLLRNFLKRGDKVLGIDPAEEIAKAASQNGIPTLTEFFDLNLATVLRADHGPADAITANNVFAHADDLAGIVEGIRRLLAADGVFAFEVSYLGDVLHKSLFDTIYHEHLAYHSVAPLQRFLAAHGLKLIDVQRIDTHGGSIRGVAAHAASKHAVQGSVPALIDWEKQNKLGEPATFKTFSRQIDRRRDEFRGLIGTLKNDGHRIAGYGAPAKATTLMYHFGIGREVVEFVVDDSPWKQGLFTPGLHVPVLGPDALYQRKPDEVIILAWNFAPSIMAKHAAFRERGGHFVIPLPELHRI